jgi:hypothetical protein
MRSPGGCSVRRAAFSPYTSRPPGATVNSILANNRRDFGMISGKSALSPSIG